MSIVSIARKISLCRTLQNSKKMFDRVDIPSSDDDHVFVLKIGGRNHENLLYIYTITSTADRATAVRRVCSTSRQQQHVKNIYCDANDSRVEKLASTIVSATEIVLPCDGLGAKFKC